MNYFLYARGETLILNERRRFKIVSGTPLTLQKSHRIFTLLARVGNTDDRKFKHGM